MYRKRRRLLTVTLLVIVALQSLVWWQLARPFEPLVRVNAVQLLSGSTLCPGDTMLTRYRITVREAGVVDVDTTITRANGVTVLSRPTKRVIFKSPMEMTVEMAWKLPVAYEGSAGDERRWQAGEYVRLTAVTTSSRGGAPVIVETPFRIGVCSVGGA